MDVVCVVGVAYVAGVVVCINFILLMMLLIKNCSNNKKDGFRACLQKPSRVDLYDSVLLKSLRAPTSTIGAEVSCI